MVPQMVQTRPVENPEELEAMLKAPNGYGLHQLLVAARQRRREVEGPATPDPGSGLAAVPDAEVEEGEDA